MEVNPIAQQDVSAISVARPAVVVNSEPVPKPVSEGTKNQASKSSVSTGEEKQLTRDELQPVTEELTKFMQSLNTNIVFSVHEKTGRLVVRVMDMNDQVVLKEFPPHQLLDTIAAIRDYVGGLLDKRA
jgi:flagellar protein FlaG